MATLIRSDGTVETVLPDRGESFELSEPQRMVGGYIELCYTKSGKQMIINEEGKLLGLLINARATLLYVHGDTDPICGDAVICEEGEIS